MTDPQPEELAPLILAGVLPPELMRLVFGGKIHLGREALELLKRLQGADPVWLFPLTIQMVTGEEPVPLEDMPPTVRDAVEGRPLDVALMHVAYRYGDYLLARLDIDVEPWVRHTLRDLTAEDWRAIEYWQQL